MNGAELLRSVAAAGCLLAALPLPAGDSPVISRQPLAVGTAPRWRPGGTPFSSAGISVHEGDRGGRCAAPPEWAPAEGLLLRWERGQFTRVVRELAVAVAGDDDGTERVYLMVDDPQAGADAVAELTAHGADPARLLPVAIPGDSVWLRDWGPAVRWRDGLRELVDSLYYPGRPLDDALPSRLAVAAAAPLARLGLDLPWGNLLVGEDRTGYASALLLADNPVEEGLVPAEVAAAVTSALGLDRLHVLPQLPRQVDGTGHVDMWLALPAPGVAVVSEFLPGSDPRAVAMTDAAARDLAALGLRVVRTPAWNGSVQGVWTHFTYTNAVRLNHRVLVPTYGAPDDPVAEAADAEALARWREAVGPEVAVVPVGSREIIWAGGALHCIARQVPRAPDEVRARLLAPPPGSLWLAGEPAIVAWTVTAGRLLPPASADAAALTAVTPGGVRRGLLLGEVAGGRAEASPPALAGAEVRLELELEVAGARVAAPSPGPLRVQPGRRVALSGLAGATATVERWDALAAEPPPDWEEAGSDRLARLAGADEGEEDEGLWQVPRPPAGRRLAAVLELAAGIDPREVAELRIAWEGHGERCAPVELYLWDRAEGAWGDGRGGVGRGHAAGLWAGLEDGRLELRLGSDDVPWVLGANGELRLLLWVARPGAALVLDSIEAVAATVAVPRTGALHQR